MKLQRLSSEAGVHLLKTLGVKGTEKEFAQLVADVKGHALTLNLLGTYLRDAHAGDIRKRDLIKLEEADAEEQGGHAFRVMDAYVASFKAEGGNGKRALSILRLLGLFDRPATADCLNALWTGEEIGGLTGPLIGISEAQRNLSLKRLEDANLVTVNREKASGVLISLDAHPLVRKYFDNRVREQFSGAWRAAHRRLYEYLRENTHEGDEPTLEDLQPLYQAVAHGCRAGLYLEAQTKILSDRIHRGNQYYSIRKLGAFGAELGASACFFDAAWSRVSQRLPEVERALVLNQASSCLRALGRLTESLEPTRASLETVVEQKNWKDAAAGAINLSELELELGEVALAVGDALRSVTYADSSGNSFQRLATRATHADALHQGGDFDEALERFREAEQVQKDRQPRVPLLYSGQGFWYCSLLLGSAERTVWRTILELETEDSNSKVPQRTAASSPSGRPRRSGG